jgi:hypothetical protein
MKNTQLHPILSRHWPGINAPNVVRFPAAQTSTDLSDNRGFAWRNDNAANLHTDKINDSKSNE